MLIGGVTVVDDVWEFEVGVDCKKDEEADEAFEEEACGDDEVDEDIEDSEDSDEVDDDTAPDDVATALTTVMVE